MQINKTKLFAGISASGCKKIEKCLRLHIMKYKKGETICHYGYGTERIGIVLSGRASILRTDYNGNEALLENLPEGAIFSEQMSYAGSPNDSILVRSMTASEVAYLDYDRLLSCPSDCKAPCSENATLKQNLIALLIDRSRILSERVKVLGCHSIREKLLCFFKLKLGGKETGRLQLPFSWVELASYINADRCAMMREIKQMNKDGIIETDKYSIRVL